MEWLIVAILLGLIPAAIAKGKGRSFGAWWACGFAQFLRAAVAEKTETVVEVPHRHLVL